ncbi:MAG: carboxypeptidase M32 [Deltaproteobacteria bacterium]|nr:carboxypeptidase M32 [Deltaproteobacteria bacterium]
MRPDDAYKWLLSHYKDTAYLFSTAELAAWDQRTYIPKNGHDHRSRQLETLARIIHQRCTHPKINDCLNSVENSNFLTESSDEIQANIRMWRREFDRQVKIPETLASALAGASAAGESAWESAFRQDDWQAFFPHLEKLVALNREKAEAIGYSNEPYDALLDEYEMGLTASTLKSLFVELKSPLVSLIQQISKSSVKPQHRILHGQFAVSEQKKVCARLLEAIGYTLDNGRIDESMHPFSVGIGPGDSRITTRYSEAYPGSGIFGCLHEAGHSLYELGLPREHYGTPAGMFLSLGVHESQSRLWENQVGRSSAFWKFAKPILERSFPQIKDVSLDELVLAVNDVSSGMIRVDADEVTYNLHVMLRFELELALFQGAVSPADLPDAWADKMQSYLGIRPQTFREGVMQDMHWSAGLFGYFPTYSIGNIYAAQLFAAAQQQLSDLSESITQGDFSPLLQWLRTNVHQKGQCLSPSELIQQATGELPTSKYFIDYCTQKYTNLYRL